MKKLFINIIILTILFVACNKVKEPVLIGTWHLDNISGGFTGNGYKADFLFLKFIDNKNCEWIDSIGNIIATAKYKLSDSKGKKCIKFYSSQFPEIFYFESKTEYNLYSNDSLILSPCFECNDCYSYLFTREN